MRLCFAYLFLCSLFFSFISCKKKDAVGGTSEGNPIVPPVGGPSNCYGEFDYEENTSFKYGQMDFVKSPASVTFFESTIRGINNFDLRYVKLLINGIALKKSYVSFVDTTKLLNDIPSFTLIANTDSKESDVSFEYNDGTPIFSDTASIPNAVKRTDGVHLTFTKFSNVDSLVFTMERAPNISVSKTVSCKNKSSVDIDITGAEIDPIMGNFNIVKMYVTVYKRTYVLSGSKSYLVNFKKVFSKEPVYVTHI